MKKMILIVLSLLLSGCSMLEQASLDSVKDAETGRRIAINCCKSWPMKSGVIKGALGPSLDELPAHSIDAMAELDVLCAEINADPNSISDEKLGMSLGLRFRFCTSIIMRVLDEYAPGLRMALY